MAHMKLVFDRGATALRALIEAYAERTATEFQQIGVAIVGPRMNYTELRCQSVHDAMKIVGMMADEGDDSLISATRFD